MLDISDTFLMSMSHVDDIGKSAKAEAVSRFTSTIVDSALFLNSEELRTDSDRPQDVHSKDKTSYGDYHCIK